MLSNRFLRPRGGHNTSPTTPELEDARRLSGPPSYNEPPRSARQSSPSLSPRTVLRPAAPEESGSHKRIRIGYEGYSPVPSEPLPAPQPAGAHKPSMGWQPRSIELPRIHESVIDRPWRPQS
ncbi:hypothetical protein IMZ48_13950 [Candidatus Bathyarchaeota archaeon]|nr:hypothetical protein [Candidatus Bathyarchaeota archaeon]